MEVHFLRFSSREEISTNLNSINFLSVFGRTENFDHSSQSFYYLMICVDITFDYFYYCFLLICFTFCCNIMVSGDDHGVVECEDARFLDQPEIPVKDSLPMSKNSDTGWAWLH